MKTESNWRLTMPSWKRMYYEAISKGLRPYEAIMLGEMQANLVMSLQLAIQFPHQWEHTMFDNTHTGILYDYKF